MAEDYLLVSQALPVTGRRTLQTDSAAEDVRAADLRADDLIRQLRVDVRRVFVDLSVQEARERELDAALGPSRRSSMSSLGVSAPVTPRDTTRCGPSARPSTWRPRGRMRAPSRARAQGQLAAFFFPTPDPSTLHAAPLSLERVPLPDAADLVAHAEAARGRSGRL